LPEGEQGFFVSMNTMHPTLLTSLRTLPRPAWILFLGTFLNKFGGFVVPFLTLYLTRQGYTLTDTAIAVGAYGVGNLAASVLGGILADTIGRRKTIMLSMFSGASAMLLLSQARSFPWIIGLAALAGLTGELYRPASSALLADLVPPGQRITAYSAYRMAFNAGWAFGPATAGLLAGYGFFWLFIGDAVSSVLFGLVAMFALPRGVRAQSQDSSWTAAWAVLRRDHRFHQVLLAVFAIGLVFFQMASTFGLYVTHLGYSAATYGAIISLNGLLVVFCELPLTTITRRFPARRIMAAGYLLAGTGFVLNAFAHTVAWLAFCMVVFTLGEMVAMPVSSAYVADLAPPNMRGRYMGAFGLTWAMALIFGPGLGMRLLDFGPTVLWMGCGALGAVAAAIILGTVRTAPVKAGLAGAANPQSAAARPENGPPSF
jgi:MFS family permease